jgi:hypothetical protein
MSTIERRLLKFIAERIESMLRRPSVWGSNLSVEDQVLQLIEIRRLILVPANDGGGTRGLMQRYVHFIGTQIPNATPQPLSVQLERLGRSAEFSMMLKTFADHELAVAKRLAPSRPDLQPIEFN